jgi:hypothetical protein
MTSSASLEVRTKQIALEHSLDNLDGSLSIVAMLT